MKWITATAIGLVALSAGTIANAQNYGQRAETPSRLPQASAKPDAKPEVGTSKMKVSAKAGPAILALQQAVNANDQAKIPAALAAAQAVAQTKEDHYFIAQLQLKAAVAANDTVGLAAAIDAIANTGLVDSARVASLYKDLGIEQFKAKQYPLASASWQKAAAITPGDVELTSMMGRSLLAQGRPADALSLMQRALQSNGVQKAPEDLYRIAVQAAFDSKSPVMNDLARQWVLAYPSADSWRNTLAIYRNSSDTDAEGALALLRLMSATGGLQNAADYRTYLTMMIEQSNFNEAHAVLDQGLAAKVIDPASDSALIASVRSKPTAAAADLAAAAKTAQSGTTLLRIGDRFYGMGDYARAADLYRQAKAKGIDAATVNLYVGMALARAGDKAGATAAFNAVTGPRADIAKYWLLYLQQHG